MYRTTRSQFSKKQILDSIEMHGLIEWGTPKGSMYVYYKDGMLVAECGGYAYGDPKGIYTFKNCAEFNRWLFDGQEYDKDGKPIEQ